MPKKHKKHTRNCLFIFHLFRRPIKDRRHCIYNPGFARIGFSSHNLGTFMTLSVKQTSVIKGMSIGALAAAVNMSGVWLGYPFHFIDASSLEQRLSIAATGSALVAIFLMVSIGRLAQHRFFNAEDIDAAVLAQSSDRARILQSLLQNTLEQTVLAIVTYFIWSLIMPEVALGAIVGAAILFATGRMLFFYGYETGAASRALGFSLTFYPTVLMLITAAIRAFALFK